MIASAYRTWDFGLAALIGGTLFVAMVTWTIVAHGRRESY